MAAGTFTLFSANKDDLRMQDLPGAVVNLSLHTSTYSPDGGAAGNSLFADATNELATGGGYTAGGQALTTDALTAITNGWKYSSDNPTWTASAGGIPAWRYGVLYVVGTLWGKTNPLIGYFVADTTPADAPATASPNPLTITVPASGWFDLV
ncbi:MAG: hypothetical protein JJD98_05790 [Polaromonas sp.]|nr:hypothetical protein [Polaromonas sp.]